MFYLWRDKRMAEGTLIVYITDYEETKDGKVQIDGHGYIDVELLFKHEIKNELIKFAQNLKS